MDKKQYIAELIRVLKNTMPDEDFSEYRKDSKLVLRYTWHGDNDTSAAINMDIDGFVKERYPVKDAIAEIQNYIKITKENVFIRMIGKPVSDFI